MRVSVGYSVFNSTGTKTSVNFSGVEKDQQYHLKVVSVTPAFSLLYSFLRNASYKVYGGLDLDITFLHFR
jgi:hypothetical protein